MSATDPPAPPPSPPSIPSLLSTQQTPPNEVVNPELQPPPPVQVAVAPVQSTATNTVAEEDPYAECSDADADVASDVPQRGWLGFCRETEDDRFERVLSRTILTRMQKNSVRRRFFEILREFRTRCFFYSVLYHVGHFTITVGSLVVPALLSVQYAGTGITFIDASSFQAQVYWTTWILSLLVTMFNGVLVLFKVDMKYYFLHTTLERLRSEGWQYLQLTGRYGGSLANGKEVPTHRNQFKYFCHYIEKLKLKQVEEEYYKYEDSQKNAGAGAAAGTAGAAATAGTAPAANTGAGSSAAAAAAGAVPNFYPPSLQKNLATLAEQAPPSVQDAIRGLVRVQQLQGNENQIITPSSKAANATLPMQSPLRQSTS